MAFFMRLKPHAPQTVCLIDKTSSCGMPRYCGACQDISNHDLLLNIMFAGVDYGGQIRAFFMRLIPHAPQTVCLIDKKIFCAAVACQDTVGHAKIIKINLFMADKNILVCHEHLNGGVIPNSGGIIIYQFGPSL
jgi:hypothetical protein